MWLAIDLQFGLRLESRVMFRAEETRVSWISKDCKLLYPTIIIILIEILSSQIYIVIYRLLFCNSRQPYNRVTCYPDNMMLWSTRKIREGTLRVLSYCRMIVTTSNIKLFRWVLVRAAGQFRWRAFHVVRTRISVSNRKNGHILSRFSGVPTYPTYHRISRYTNLYDVSRYYIL